MKNFRADDRMKELISGSMQAVEGHPIVFRIYEHETLRVGEKLGGNLFARQHFESLAALAVQLGDRYFKVGYQSIRFRHYVGIISTPMVTVELLPKTDRRSPRQQGRWQRILLEMLKACSFIRHEIPGTSQLDTRPGQLLEWYVQHFLQELDSLLRHGLVHTYEQQSNNEKVWKGQLQFAQQIRHNYLHKERFFVRHHTYTNRHPANLMLAAALQRLQYLPLAPDLLTRIRQLLPYLPHPAHATDWWTFAQDLHWEKDRQMLRYQPALTIASHILRDEHPDIRFGKHIGLALLFDMNALFEEYLYRQLLRWKPENVQVERQVSRRFWGQNRLRPDLVITSPQHRWVLDAKWRVLKQSRPSAEELRQIYVYCDYFNADHGVLIFPQTDKQQADQRLPFLPNSGGLPHRERSCQICYASVLNSEGGLNMEMGKMLYDVLTE